MKKKMLVLFLAVGMILGGCQNTQEKPQTGKGEETSRDETEDTPEEEKNYDVKLSKNLYDFEFAINDTVFHLPQNEKSFAAERRFVWRKVILDA